MRAVREAIGPDLRLFTDAHFKWDLPFAQRMQEGLAEFDIGWLENPLPLDDLAGYERLAALGGAPLAAGESERTRFPFVRLIDAGVFYLQPDVNRVGGLTETLRICGLAASHNRPVCPHQGWLHTWHLIAARACCPIGEYFPKGRATARRRADLAGAGGRARGRARRSRGSRPAGLRLDREYSRRAALGHRVTPIPDQRGLRQRRPGKRLKSVSLEWTSAWYSIASAAACESVVRFAPTPAASRFRRKRVRWSAPGLGGVTWGNRNHSRT